MEKGKKGCLRGSVAESVRDYDSDIVGLYSCYYILQTAFSGLDSLLKYRHFKS